MTSTDRAAILVGRGKVLEWITLGWNVIGVIVLAFLATAAASVALVGFGLDSLIEISASTVQVTDGRVTFIGGLLVVAVLFGLVLDLTLGWWWADPLAGYVIVYYATREALGIFRLNGGSS